MVGLKSDTYPDGLNLTLYLMLKNVNLLKFDEIHWMEDYN